MNIKSLLVLSIIPMILVASEPTQNVKEVADVPALEAVVPAQPNAVPTPPVANATAAEQMPAEAATPKPELMDNEQLENTTPAEMPVMSSQDA